MKRRVQKKIINEINKNSYLRFKCLRGDAVLTEKQAKRHRYLSGMMERIYPRPQLTIEVLKYLIAFGKSELAKSAPAGYWAYFNRLTKRLNKRIRRREKRLAKKTGCDTAGLSIDQVIIDDIEILQEKQ